MTNLAINQSVCTITVPFHGSDLFVVNHNGEPYTPMKPIIDGMGMDWASQFTKLKKRFKTSVVKITMQLPGDDQRRDVICLALRKLSAWLNTISPNKVRPEIRDNVIRYQEECDDVLYEYWTKGQVTNPRKTSTDERTPLRDAINMLVGKRGIMYPEAYSYVHQRFNVAHIDELPAEQLPVVIEYVHRLALEGEYLCKANNQLSLPISYPMGYFNQYGHIREMNEHALSAPWRYPADMLVPNGDNPNPLGRMLGELKNMGCEVDAALFQLLSLQHHLESLRSKISSIQRAVM
ncbi:phage antirepressor N-terminal domain-containing protein [Yersinia enterocolitica]|nr:hypothetical protein [Yersinia enterocolitica]